jgi:urease accessory protein
MLRLNAILADAADERISERLHELDHEGRLERITLSAADTQRKRLQVATDKGTDCAAAMQR